MKKLKQNRLKKMVKIINDKSNEPRVYPFFSSVASNMSG